MSDGHEAGLLAPKKTAPSSARPTASSMSGRISAQRSKSVSSNTLRGTGTTQSISSTLR
jgi:hypothetical protein